MRNPIGMHSSLWWGTPIEPDLRKVIAYTARTTADCVELNPNRFLDLSPDERRQLRRYADDCGIRINVNGGLGAEYDIASADPDVRAAGSRRITGILDAMADLEVTMWSGCMFAGYCTKPAADILADKRRARDQSIESMRPLLRHAQEYGIVLAPELLNRYEQYIINTAEEGVAYCEDTGFANCKLLLDTFHMTIEEDNVADAIRYAQSRGRLGYLHAGETNRRIPTGGPSNLDWKGIADTIRDCGYTGMVVIEPFELTTAYNARSVCVWRDYNDPGDVDAILAKAKKGVEFLRGL